MSNNIVNKYYCIKLVNMMIYSIHPLINTIIKNNTNKNNCFILPHKMENDNLIYYTMDENALKKKLNKFSSIIIDDKKQSIDNKIIPINKIKNNDINSIFNFMIPINSSNFLEIIFNIKSIDDLNNWLLIYDLEDKKTVYLIFDLFWINYYNIIDDNIDTFIKLNQQIILYYFYKKIDNNIMAKIINKLIKRNYGKKIKYLDKIKKYLIKYI
jgi:hypothetical protein